MRDAPRPQPARPTAVPTTITVLLKRCGCGVLRGEVCACRRSRDELRRLAKRPIFLDLRTTRNGSADAAPPAENGF